ncbi:MAG TPA: hypothetical protein VGU64_21890 [Terriglobales bacterium]|nr:hypothetical protein [Terriglobales bacterium]
MTDGVTPQQRLHISAALSDADRQKLAAFTPEQRAVVDDALNAYPNVPLDAILTEPLGGL